MGKLQLFFIAGVCLVSISFVQSAPIAPNLLMHMHWNMLNDDSTTEYSRIDDMRKIIQGKKFKHRSKMGFWERTTDLFKRWWSTDDEIIEAKYNAYITEPPINAFDKYEEIPLCPQYVKMETKNMKNMKNVKNKKKDGSSICRKPIISIKDEIQFITPGYYNPGQSNYRGFFDTSD